MSSSPSTGTHISLLAALEEAAATNEPVNEELKSTAHVIVANGEAALNDINNLLATSSDFRSLVSGLEETKARLATKVEKNRSIASMVRKVPRDVWEQVFIRCAMLQPITVWHLPGGDPMAAFPWSLTGVCKKWRHIALNMPHLWTRLHALAFKFTTGEEQKCSRIFRNADGERRLECILRRSNVVPLSLKIVWLDVWGYVEIPRLLRATASRLRSLEFKAAPNLTNVHPEPRLLSFLDFLASEPDWLDFSKLMELHLHLGDVPISLRFLRSACNLKSLTLHSNYQFHQSCLTTLPDQLCLNKLTRLQLSDRTLPTEVIYKIICNSPVLESLIVTAPSTSSDQIFPDDLSAEYTLSQLADLSIYVYSETEISADSSLWWLERLRLPSLKSFRIGRQVHGCTGPSWGCPVPQLQTIQASDVICLTLDIAMYMDDLLRLLQSLPQIQKLELRNMCPAHTIVRHLASGTILPNLVTLKCGLYCRRLDEYLVMLHKRTRRSIAPAATLVSLRKVELVIYPAEAPESWSFNPPDSPRAAEFNALLNLGWSFENNPQGWRAHVKDFSVPPAVGLFLFRFR